MANLRDGETGAPGAISVGGPGGIQITGGRIQVGGGPLVGSNTSMPMQAPAATPTPLVAVDLTRMPELFVRHSGLIAAGLSIGAGLVLLSAATVIAVLQLPWLLFAVPMAFGAALLSVAGAIALRARKRQTTGGLDPEVERRILDVAVSCQGRVTVMAVARALRMPLAEADEALMMLARSGYVTLDNDPSTGVVVYIFPDVEAGLIHARRLP